MRINEPVTNKEIDFPPDRCIVSRTDLKGKITFVNDDFVTISGFTREELIGRPHNLIRHPDMPPAAFADMWATIQRGLPWEGLVKNRAKNGDHYWVRANVTPELENGAVTGYVSVRTKPSRADVDAAGRLYAAINAGTAGRTIVREGQVIDDSLVGRVVRWSRSVRNRAVVGFVLVMAVMAAQVLAVLSAAPGGSLMMVSTLLLAMAAVVALVSVIGVSAGIRKPLDEIQGHLDRFTVQDFDAVVRPSPIQEFTRVTFLLNAVRAHLAFARQEQDELQRQAKRQRTEALKAMADHVEAESRAAVDKVAQHTDAMRNDAATMATGAQTVSHNAASVAAASNQALASAQTVAAAGEELNASIAEITTQVTRAADVSRVAVDQGGKTSTILETMTKEVDQIAEIADLIQAIASKTNLLALNASIEAARAGDAGKGFAVVAEEVKGLANQTAALTQRITEQIHAVSAVTGESVESVRQMVEKVADIDTVAASIAEAMQNQAEATAEISRSVCETSDAAQEVARQIETVSAEARSTEEKSQQLMTASADVAAAVTALTSAVVEAVRTSTDETNRRRHERIRVSARVLVRDTGRTVNAQLLDISAGGARLGDVGSLRVGARVSIAAETSSVSWDGRVVDITEGGVHVAFDREYDIDVAQVRRASLRSVA
ncbi:methyl-accepting chemotaxis protein [uncultured Rhodospira sp.]|uniref:methyl-accepting chemotaxis protein n=1 Tax=uncultured Rhodospira sp. TaxID=1936189 RepID=UPI00260D790C|nr:methyl-accepting chemotaxis protein [uncultured Rhodospira sp.]